MNNTIFFILHSLAHKSVFFDKVVVFVTEPLIYIMILIISFYFLFDKNILTKKFDFKFILGKIKNFLPVFFTGLFSWMIGDLLKNIFRIDRPYITFTQVSTLVSESGFSFPSLHSTLIAALAFSVYFKNKKYGYICLFIALLIGLSRIIVGVHYPLDVLGGFILGFVVAFTVNKILRKYNLS